MTRPYDPQYPRPLVTPQAEPQRRWSIGPDLEPYNGPGDGLDSARLIRIEHDPHAELSAGEWREATREEQTDT